jgi:hypothetical protein
MTRDEKVEYFLKETMRYIDTMGFTETELEIFHYGFKYGFLRGLEARDGEIFLEKLLARRMGQT